MGIRDTSSNYTVNIKRKIIELGADLVAVAETTRLSQLKVYPPDLLAPFHRAISIAVKLPRVVFDQIDNQPTPAYSSIYRGANHLLDQISSNAANILNKDGFNSLPIPASQTVDRENLCGAISHKAVGNQAGLGWQGKSLLLVSPQYGPCIRLATILTAAPLDIDAPMANRCGKCTLCQDACPAGAIKGASTKYHYKSRGEAINFQLCVEKLREFSKLPGIGANICGVCIKVCPFGR